MLKWLAVTISLLFGAGMLIGTTSISIPVKSADYEDCRNTVKAEHRPQETCKHKETLWERGLSDPIAYYTLWLALFTWGLATVGMIQGAFTYEEIRLARDEFGARNRPNIAIRFIEGPALDEITKRDTVWITFVNKGGSEATIVELGSGLGFWKNSDWEGASVPDRQAKIIAPITLAVGEPHRHPLVVNDDSSFQFGFFQAMYQPGDATVGVIGTLRYRDKNMLVRETGFHRFYDARSKCWRPVKDSQYEYAD